MSVPIRGRLDDPSLEGPGRIEGPKDVNRKKPNVDVPFSRVLSLPVSSNPYREPRWNIGLKSAEGSLRRRTSDTNIVRGSLRLRPSVGVNVGWGTVVLWPLQRGCETSGVRAGRASRGVHTCICLLTPFTLLLPRFDLLGSGSLSLILKRHSCHCPLFPGVVTVLVKITTLQACDWGSAYLILPSKWIVYKLTVYVRSTIQVTKPQTLKPYQEKIRLMYLNPLIIS